MTATGYLAKDQASTVTLAGKIILKSPASVRGFLLLHQVGYRYFTFIIPVKVGLMNLICGCWEWRFGRSTYFPLRFKFVRPYRFYCLTLVAMYQLLVNRSRIFYLVIPQ